MEPAQVCATRANLQRHIGSLPLRILDAGGGNGLDAIPLAQDGHQVDVIDSSPSMLAHAAANAAAAPVSDHLVVQGGDILTIAAQFPVAAYYGIRCLCDYWGDNQRKADPATFAQVKRLEFALTDRHPYNLLARYVQIIATRA